MKYLIPITLICFAACTRPNLRNQSISEIANAEKDFAKMAQTEGIADAFAFYADSNAVISRGRLIKGKDSIRAFYSAAWYKTAKVSWSPDFVEASEAGDIGYTYGGYTWESSDTTAAKITGTFHTVWRKQADGQWKYVWD